MSPNPNNSFDQRLQDAARRAEEELRRFVRYVDAEVVPEVRRNSSTALRAAAVHLQKLADTMDDAKSQANTASGKSSSPPDSNTPASGD